MNESFARETGTVKMIPIGMIRTLPQVRTTFKESSIQELAADIRAHGVLQPLVVTPDGKGFNLVIGERRLRAIQHLGAPFVPAIVAEIAEGDREEIQLIENIQREDLSAKDLAGSILGLWRKFGSVVEVARRCNKSKSWVSKRLALALEVGPLTAELIDGNGKDVEMLYAFATLEKADEITARALLPALLERKKGRAHVKTALADVLDGKAGARKEPEPADTTGDLFDDQPTTPAAANGDAAELMQIKGQLEAALVALRRIRDTPKHYNPMTKWDHARDIAAETLKAFGE